MSKDLKIVLPSDGSIQKAIAAARLPEKGPECFLVLRFAGGTGSTLEIAGEGAGGWAEASALLTAADGAYVLLRKDHKVEMAKTVKFAHVEWFPNGLKAMRRVQLSSLKKPVEDLLKPFHVGLSATELADVNQQMIDDRIGFASGTASHVKPAGRVSISGETPAAPAVDSPKAEEPKKDEKKYTPKPAAAKPAVVPSSAASTIKFSDGTAVADAIKDARNDKKDVNWIAASYSDRDTLTLIGSGSDGFDGLMGKLPEDGISFGLLRVSEMIDGKSKTTKFVFIRCIPDSTKPMKKAEITTRGGAIEKVFGQSHVTFDISKKADLTESVVMDKVGAASGSKSNVK